MKLDNIEIIPCYVDGKIISLKIVVPEKNVCFCKSHIGNTVEILIGNNTLRKRIFTRKSRHKIHVKNIT